MMMSPPLLLLFALLFCSCAGRQEYLLANNVLADAEKLLASGRPQESVNVLNLHSDKFPDKKLKCEAELLMGRAFFHMDKTADAVKSFKKTAEGCAGNRSAAGWALYYTGRIFYEKLKIASNGEEFLIKAIESYPDQAASVRSFQYLASIWDKKKILDFCEKKSKEFYFTDIADNLLFEASKIYMADGKDDLALYIFVILKKYYPKSPFINDVLMLKAEIDLGRGEYLEAIGSLREVLAMREIAHLFGSYERPFYPKALYMIGNIYADKLKLYNEAVEAFSSLEKNYPKSSLKDDALFRIYEIHASNGDTIKGTDVLKTLAAKYPDTAKGKKAAEILKK